MAVTDGILILEIRIYMMDTETINIQTVNATLVTLLPSIGPWWFLSSISHYARIYFFSL